MMCEGKILGDRVDGKFVLGKNQDCLNSWGHFLGLPPFFFFIWSPKFQMLLSNTLIKGLNYLSRNKSLWIVIIF